MNARNPIAKGTRPLHHPLHETLHKVHAPAFIPHPAPYPCNLCIAASLRKALGLRAAAAATAAAASGTWGKGSWAAARGGNPGWEGRARPASA